ncbi:hypothetical protein FQN57_005961 [Myotisia sp. PD_48]|nr:hypothetical protein FQN57_005961 [Myotisia sp. PD_48]
MSSVSSKQRKRQRSEQQPQDSPLKRWKLAPQNSTYWDTLSKIWLTKRALVELDRRNTSEEHSCLYPQSIQAQPPLTRMLHAKLKQQLEPICNPLVGFAPKHIKSIERKVSHGRKRSAKSPPPQTRHSKTTKTTCTSVYSRNFEQKLVDNGFYPDDYEYPDRRTPALPNNWTEINRRLVCSRAFLSPSKFTSDDFRTYKRTNRHVSKENPITALVIPTIEGEIGDTKCIGGGYPFGNLAPLVKKPEPNGEEANYTESNEEQSSSNKPELAQTTLDRFYGARPEQLERPIRNTLNNNIIPSTQDNLPMLPNFFLETKGPDGSIAVVERQALYDGALGARGMHALQSYKLENAIYDNNAHTISSTYYGGTLKLYTHHIVPSAKKNGESETIMTQFRSFAMTDSRETFQQGASAYRNLRD